MERKRFKLLLRAVTIEIALLFIFTLVLSIAALVYGIHTSILAGSSFKNLTLVLSFLMLSDIIILLLSVIELEKLITQERNNIVNLQVNLEKQNWLVTSLVNINKKIIEYDKYKTDFFSNISHELKTPLAVIIGAIQLMEFKRENDRRNTGKHLSTIKHNCYRLLRLVNNILDLSRLDSGYLKSNLTNINIVCLVEEITQSVVPYIEQKGLSLLFDTEEEEVIIAVDIDKIERIILNLLSNAIKFTPTGGNIWVNISINNKKVLISVKDSGPGIPKSKLGIIFERFKQADTSLTREHEGSGIGLSLVKSFVEMHNGKISVQSEENSGSEFIVELPVRLCEENKVIPCKTNENTSKIIEAINIEFSEIYTAAS